MGGGTFQMLDLLPVGFRFQPTDKELVSHYLKLKLQGDDSDSLVANIPVLDLCKVEPWNIPAFSVIKSDEAECYFFSPLHSNRVTRHGFWKYVGSDRNIKTTRTNIVIGTRKTLVFCRGRVETDWVIHEYHAAATIDDAQRCSGSYYEKGEMFRKPVSKFERHLLDRYTTFFKSGRTFVLCRLMGSAKKKAALICEEREFSRLEDMASDHESEDAESEGITDVCDVLPEENMDSIFQTPQQELSHNANFRNENSSRQTLEDKFLNSISSKDFVRSEEKRHAFVKDFTQPESLRRPFRTMHTLRRVNSESSETDAEVVSALIKKEFTIEVSEKSREAIARNKSSRDNSETRSHQSSNVNRKVSFIFPETSSSSQSLLPDSVYLVNIVIGIMIFIVISLDVLSYVKGW